MRDIGTTGTRAAARRVLSGVAVAAACAFVAPAAAGAAPAPVLPLPAEVPVVPGYEALAALAPTLLDAAERDAASPQSDLLVRAKALLATAPLSDQAKRILTSIITFLDGSGGGGPEIPQNGPVISQFFYPTVGKGCISATADSVASALAVPGPAQLPPPGPAAGQAGFVFTALGTAPLADVQAAPLTANWVNVDTGRTGATVLTGAAGINPDGPATLSALADTGTGRVLAAVSGSISTEAGITCSFLPTIGAFVV
ncbi:MULTISPECIES: Rv1157c family protein [unclassified Rhodococcus (in: high G+C Gram-positive bacteria)]|uniref:Rv1157c family protein n=1 Tax=unclassified Rhodococcus (in: high G+C Gram-positive bacteria) TaxID=192944 RepID=UPI000B0178A3|nr:MULTISPECIES: hypothetical protein [unclassified Rhodococcus (in: high G+C Gram-positive bacteria)]MDQ1202351.1 hypothetical protein [Rhodococcus sp. SORGH_AS_0303]